MRKLFITALIISAIVSLGLAQEIGAPKSTDEMLKMGRAPSGPEGIGRAVVHVLDEEGNPVKGAYAKLESVWGDQFCESWDWTNVDGVSALKPIHMGRLKLKVKAKGYRTQEVEVSPNSLSEPIRVTLERKK